MREAREEIRRLEELERKKVIRRGSRPIARELLDSNPPGDSCGVLDALLEDRSFDR